MWKLVIEDDEGKRTVVPLTRDDYTVGRKEGNTIRLTERNVSRDHAKLSRRGSGAAAREAKPTAPSIANGDERADSSDSYVLEDLTSYNGVYVNGLRVAHSQELQHGDLIQIGDYRIVLQDDAVVEATSAAGGTDPKAMVPTGARASLLMERPNRMVMLAGPTPGAEYPLDQERMTVGRAEDASISINHNSVSRLHCEIHALGDGRFEIVDKGSSNGVRVNSAELRRGIIEAGDVIELGDVKFKFVGAGQIFRPGATDSQQLAAIGERTAAQIVGGKRKSSMLPYVLFIGVVGVGGACAWWFIRPPTGVSPDASASASSDGPEAQALADAKKMCLTGNDCVTAHEKLSNEISKSSPLRSSADFHDVEQKWAAMILARADAEDDLDRRRNMLIQVAKAPTVDDVLRKTAQAKLDEMGDTATNPDQLPLAARDAGVLYDAGALKHLDAGRRADFDAAVAAPTTSTVPTGTDDRQQALNGNKAGLEQKVYSGHGTTTDIALLRSLCRETGDKACVAQCNSMLAPPKPTSTH